MMTHSLASPPVTISGSGEAGERRVAAPGARIGVVSVISGRRVGLPPRSGVDDWTVRRSVAGTGDSRLSRDGCRTVPNRRREGRGAGVPVIWVRTSSTRADSATFWNRGDEFSS